MCLSAHPHDDDASVTVGVTVQRWKNSMHCTRKRYARCNHKSNANIPVCDHNSPLLQQETIKMATRHAICKSRRLASHGQTTSCASLWNLGSTVDECSTCSAYSPFCRTLRTWFTRIFRLFCTNLLQLDSNHQSTMFHFPALDAVCLQFDRQTTGHRRQTCRQSRLRIYF